MVIALFIIGEQFEDLSRQEAAPWRYWHVSLGMIAAVLILARTAWRVVQGSPEKIPDPRAFQVLSSVVMGLLMLATLALIVSGPLIVWSNGRPINVFDIVQLPSPLERNRGLHEILEEVHEIAANALLPLVGLHVVGALKHLLINRDNAMSRMLKPQREG